MKSFMKSIALAGGLLCTTTSAFQTSPTFVSRQMMAPGVRLFAEKTTTPDQVITYFEDLEKAVDCAETFGKCNIDLLHELAEKVDAGSDTCMWETTQELCQKEIDDRKDLADVLRLQAELRLRMEYLDTSNLFVDNVKAEHDMLERDDEMELLSEDAM